MRVWCSIFLLGYAIHAHTQHRLKLVSLIANISIAPGLPNVGAALDLAVDGASAMFKGRYRTLRRHRFRHNRLRGKRLLRIRKQEGVHGLYCNG